MSIPYLVTVGQFYEELSGEKASVHRQSHSIMYSCLVAAKSSLHVFSSSVRQYEHTFFRGGGKHLDPSLDPSLEIMLVATVDRRAFLWDDNHRNIREV